MKHKNAEVLHAYVDGKTCEYWSNNSNKWQVIHLLETFDWANKVRIKPEPVISSEYLIFYKNFNTYHRYHCQQLGMSNKEVTQIKLTYKDDVLESSEVIQ
jgi:hypothetical protein